MKGICTSFLAAAILSIASAAAQTPRDSLYISGQLASAKIVYARNKDSANHILQQLQVWCKQKGFTYGTVSALLESGNNAVNVGQFDKGMTLLNEGIKYCDTSGTTAIYLASFYNALASIYTYKGNSERAILFYQQAIQYHERYSSYIGIPRLYNNIAVVFNHIEEYEKALYYLDKAETMLKPDSAYRLLASILVNKGNSYTFLKRSDKGVLNMLAALRLAEKHQIYDIRQIANSNIGGILIGKGKPSEAIPYLLAATVKECTNPYYKNLANISLGKAYSELKQYNKAETYLLTALKDAGNNKIIKDVIRCHDELSNLYALMGNISKAYAHEKTYRKLQDSATKEERINAINQLEIKYRTAQKDKDIVNKQLYIQKQEQILETKNKWILLIATGSATLLIILIALYAIYKNKQKLHAKQIHIINQDKQIDELKAIMNGEEKERTRMARELHDSIMIQFAVVKMNLSTMLGRNAVFIDRNEVDKLRPQLENAMGELRRTAHNLMPDMLLEEGLPEALNYFCNNLQRDTDLDIQFLYLGDLPRLQPEFELSVYRIVQELIQNILKHAKASNAIIQLGFREAHLNIVVEDDGVGMNEKIIIEEQDKGMGLKSIMARVRALNGNMTMESESGIGTTLTLDFHVTDLKQNKVIAI